MWLPESEKPQAHEMSRSSSHSGFRRRAKYLHRTLAIVALFAFYCFFLSGRSSFHRGNAGWGDSSDDVAAKGPANFSSKLVKFWDEFATLLLDSEPPVPLQESGVEAKILPFQHKDRLDLSEPQSTLNLPEYDIRVLRKAHADFVKKSRGLHKKLPFKKGTKGIVTTAAGDYLSILVVSLRILRNSGSTLPVEVFMESQSSYERGICDTILPSLNARCYVFSDILNTGSVQVTLASFQFKVFSVLFSSFDDVLLMDTDNLAIHRPEDLMAAEPYTSAGLVTWPDYWVNTYSKEFWQIAGIDNPPPLSEHAASESGQVLLSKSKHSHTLLLMAYYNLFGFSHYYTLMSQHAIGQGDKETFLAAALALNASHYVVDSPVSTPGFTPKGPGAATMGNFAGAGCIQHDPRDDADPFFTDTRPAFMHVQSYKLNAAKLVGKWFNEINGRLLGNREHMLSLFGGRDIEKEIWDELVWTSCVAGKHFREFQKNEAEICRDVKSIRDSIVNEGEPKDLKIKRGP